VKEDTDGTEFAVSVSIGELNANAVVVPTSMIFVVIVYVAAVVGANPNVAEPPTEGIYTLFATTPLFEYMKFAMNGPVPPVIMTLNASVCPMSIIALVWVKEDTKGVESILIVLERATVFESVSNATAFKVQDP
jgi:hypothetical protein